MRIPVRTKLAASYAVIFMAMIGLTYFATRVTQKIYLDDVVQHSHLLSEEMFMRMNQRIFYLVGQLQIESQSSYVQEYFISSNRRFNNMPDAKEYVLQTDAAWISSSGKMPAQLMKSVLNNGIAHHLREVFIARFSKEYGVGFIRSIIATNTYGAVIASSGSVANYYQGGNYWWQEAREKGVYIGRIDYDEDSASYGIKVAFRVTDEKGRFLGVIEAEFDVKGLVREAEVGMRKYNSTDIYILTHDGRLVYSTKPHKFLEDISDIDFVQHIEDEDGHFITGKPQAALYVSTHSKGYKFFQGFEWTLVISHQLDEVLEPYRKLQKDIFEVALLLILFSVVIIYLLDRSITNPLNMMIGSVKRLAAGEMDVSVPVTSNDELGELSSAFNLMVGKRQHAEEALRESEERYRRIAEDMPVFICRFRQDGEMIYVNDSFHRFFSNGEPDLIGKSFFTHIAEEDREKVQSAISELTVTVPSISLEYRMIGTEKELFWHRWTTRAIFDEQGKIFAYQAIGEDISSRKKSEEDKARLEKRLQQAHKMEAVGTLAGGIAHDFNNILAVIIGYAGLADKEAQAGSKLKGHLENMLIGANRAKDLVKQILAFSRQSEVVRIPLQLQSLIKESLKMLRSSLPTTISIQDDIDSRCGVVLVDPTQVHQIIMNLCTNAYHAMGDRGGTLMVTLRNISFENTRRLHDLHLTSGDYVELAVSDTGCGIAPDIIDKIFDPYFTTKEAGRGTGMGLSIVHGIINDYKGTITVESEVGVGTIFRVYFPVSNEDAESSAEPDSQMPHGKERILFVDDEEMLGELGRDMLEPLGYTVTVRMNGMEAWTTFQNQPDQFDLVISDQTMPGMTGIELAKRILQLRPDMPVILCTGYSNLVDEQSAKKQGISEFALKPIAPKSIAILIRKVLDKQVDKSADS